MEVKFPDQDVLHFVRRKMYEVPTNRCIGFKVGSLNITDIIPNSVHNMSYLAAQLPNVNFSDKANMSFKLDRTLSFRDIRGTNKGELVEMLGDSGLTLSLFVVRDTGVYDLNKSKEVLDGMEFKDYIPIPASFAPEFYMEQLSDPLVINIKGDNIEQIYNEAVQKAINSLNSIEL